MSFEYANVFTAEWRGQEAVAQYTDSLSNIQSAINQTTSVTTNATSTWTDAYGKVRTITFELGEDTKRMASVSMRSLRNVFFTMQMGLFYWSMLESAQYRAEAAAIALENAQDTYNSAVREYGRNSEQAERAERNLTRTRRYIETANTRATISYAGMSIQIASMTAQFIRQTGVTQINTSALTANTQSVAANVSSKLASVASSAGYIAATTAMKIADAAHTAVLWVKAHLMSVLTFGLAAVAGAAAMYVLYTQMATKETQALSESMGELPSFGLVKSLEDVAAGYESLYETTKAHEIMSLPTFKLPTLEAPKPVHVGIVVGEAPSIEPPEPVEAQITSRPHRFTIIEPARTRVSVASKPFTPTVDTPPPVNVSFASEAHTPTLNELSPVKLSIMSEPHTPTVLEPKAVKASVYSEAFTPEVRQPRDVELSAFTSPISYYATARPQVSSINIASNFNFRGTNENALRRALQEHERRTMQEYRRAGA